jgi:hypothetical protein
VVEPVPADPDPVDPVDPDPDQDPDLDLETETDLSPLALAVIKIAIADKLARRVGVKCYEDAVGLMRASKGIPKKDILERNYKRQRPCHGTTRPIITYTKKRKTLAIIILPQILRDGRGRRASESPVWERYLTNDLKSGGKPRNLPYELEQIGAFINTRETIVASAAAGTWAPVQTQVRRALAGAGRAPLISTWDRTGAEWLDTYWSVLRNRPPASRETWWGSCIYRVVEIGRQRHCTCPDGRKCKRSRVKITFVLP